MYDRIYVAILSQESGREIMAILVTGATGWIGGRVCNYLSSKGFNVVALGRKADPGESGPWSSYVSLDISEPLTGLKDAHQIDTVIHCAGYAHRASETLEDQKLFYAVNREGTRNVVEWCYRHRVRRLLYLSTIAVYDWMANSSEPVTEAHPVGLQTHYARSKFEGEKIVCCSPTDCRIVRLATVFGHGDYANFSRMAYAIKRRSFPVPGKGSAQKSIIPVELAAELIAKYALMEDPPHRLINMGLPKAPSLREIVDAYHVACNFPRSPSVPVSLARVAGALGNVAEKVFGRFPFTTANLDKLTRNTEISVTRMLKCFPDCEFKSFKDYLLECKEWYSSLSQNR